MSSDPTPASLIIRIRDHSDRSAWESFCDLYGALVYRYCCSRGLPGADAADVSQEILIRVARAVRSFEYDRERGKFRNWLGRIVNNEIIRWQQSQKRHPRTTDSLDGITSPNENWGEHFEQHILNAALEIAKSHFESDTWKAFELVWIQNLNATEAAEKLQRPLQFIYTSKSRVLKRLNLEIDRLADEDLF